MKSLFLLMTCLTALSTCPAQFAYDSLGKIIPFSLSREYKQLIDTSKVNTCMLPSYNNDSLYWEANFENRYIKKDSGEIQRPLIVKAGIRIDTIIAFKQVANKYILPKGILWLYKIESKTAESLDIVLDKFNLQNGALLSIFSSNTTSQDHNLHVYNTINWAREFPKEKFVDMVVGNELFIEYYEPNGAKAENIIISSLHYGFYNSKKKNGLKTLPNHLKKSIPISNLNKTIDYSDFFDV